MQTNNSINDIQPNSIDDISICSIDSNAFDFFDDALDLLSVGSIISVGDEALEIDQTKDTKSKQNLCRSIENLSPSVALYNGSSQPQQFQPYKYGASTSSCRELQNVTDLRLPLCPISMYLKNIEEDALFRFGLAMKLSAASRLQVLSYVGNYNIHQDSVSL